MPAEKIHLELRGPAARIASTVSATMPPSPRLSARIRTMTYFTVTTMVSDQAISDSTP